MPPRTRVDQSLNTLSIDGKSYGIWDSLSGGGMDSEDVKDRAGGVWIEEAAGGPPTVENVVLARYYSLDRDHSIIHELFGLVGRGRCSASQHPVDPQGNPYGRPIVYTGILKRVTPPERDTNSSDIARIEIEISTDGTIG